MEMINRATELASDFNGMMENIVKGTDAMVAEVKRTAQQQRIQDQLDAYDKRTTSAQLSDKHMGRPVETPYGGMSERPAYETRAERRKRERTELNKRQAAAKRQATAKA